ncbi:hypothetical protein [Paenibacillus sp. HB172176]|uniref:hypothetical protein n=1 Tax=Paenibacillus sp. HB172176 TaxID=2493690 RepID=UPI00143C99C1|nr:hypothetical protein [Paenibacillus sp. HB172176]
MTTAKMKKYIRDMDEYIKKISAEPRRDSLEFLQKAGIVDKDGKLSPHYQEK